MRAVVTADLVGVGATSVIKKLQNPDKWSTWMWGVEVLEQLASTEDRIDLRLAIQGPRAFVVAVAVYFQDSGLRFSLLEGPLAALNGFVMVSDESITWDLDVRGLTAIPSVLANELSSVVLPRWTTALLQEGQG